MLAPATGLVSGACSLTVPSTRFESSVDFHTAVDALPSAPHPPATRKPSVTATAAAPARGAGSFRPLTTVHDASALVAGSSPSDQIVSVALPSGPGPPIREPVPFGLGTP